MAEVTQVHVSVTKQVRPYEPVRIEVTVDKNDVKDTPESLYEEAMQAVEKGFAIALGR